MIRPETQYVAEAILRYSSCLIATHVNPEGDAIGSMLGLALALEQRGMTVSCYDRDGVPENCRFLPTWERVMTSLPDSLPPLVIFVDADRLERCNLSLNDLPRVETIVRIDHHVSDVQHHGPSLVDTKAAAAGELVFELLTLLDVAITPDIATCLHTAIMVDTGRFSYTNTTPTTHRIAAELIAAGADLPTIVNWIWGRVKLAAAKLLGSALSSVQVSADGRITWAVLRNENFQCVDASPEDTEGIIDSIRNIRDSRVAVLFSEKRGVTRVSLRSDGSIDVAALARQFNGGGHVKAAGISFDEPIDFVIAKVIQAIQNTLPLEEQHPS